MRDYGKNCIGKICITFNKIFIGIPVPYTIFNEVVGIAESYKFIINGKL
jgi:hypothetical protein